MKIKSILKKFINSPNTFLQYCYNMLQIKRYHVQYDRSLRIRGRVYISGTGICLGKNVQINSNYKANPIGGDGRTILRTNGDGIIVIGENTGISNSTIVAYRSVIIGKNVLIGGSCKIYDTDFHSLKLSDRLEHPLENICSKEIVIEDGVFLGAYCIVLKGVTIGKNSVIGAGSVVTKTIPGGEIWAGNPAKFIKKV
ncbi:acyltransferase [bacterium 1XD21-13]|nr:acyltransferase [bacterium 1XD21-13]